MLEIGNMTWRHTVLGHITCFPGKRPSVLPPGLDIVECNARGASRCSFLPGKHLLSFTVVIAFVSSPWASAFSVKEDIYS